MGKETTAGENQPNAGPGGSSPREAGLLGLPPGQFEPAAGTRRAFARLLLAAVVVVSCLGLIGAHVAGSAKSDPKDPPAADPHRPPASTATTPDPTESAHTAAPALLFDDEFNGSSLDPSKWSEGWLSSGITPPVNSLEDGCYDPRQVTVAKGELDLTAIAKPESCAGITRPFASGLVNTDSTFRFTYGYAEARIWLQTGPGLWPAWWTDGQSWPNDGEIDVLEVFGSDTNPQYHYHYAGCDGSCAPGGETAVPGSSSGWHTYAVDREPGSITWYYDGRQVWSISGAVVTSAPQYLILNLAVTSQFAGAPAVMRVDYVRVYASKP